MVSLRPLDDSNRHAALALRVAAGQERFVSSVADSLAEAAEHPGAHPSFWVIHSDESAVGFAMTCDAVEGADYIPRYLWKLLVDQRHQRQGHGTAALDLITEYFRGRPGPDVLTTSARLGDGGPVAFYERYGFERTGEEHGGEAVLRLALS